MEAESPVVEGRGDSVHNEVEVQNQESYQMEQDFLGEEGEFHIHKKRIIEGPEAQGTE